ncbi:MAG: hypothetical protein ABW166_10285 [Sedimenticola sp.]
MNICTKAIATFLLLSTLFLCPFAAQAYNTGFASNHQHYTLLERPGISAFIEHGITLSTHLYGQPEITIKEVDLRISQPTDPNSKLPRGFSGTSLRDQAEGSFTIFLSRKPGSYAFHGQLAHEIAHLHNPRLFDVYVEGLNMLFAEKLLVKEGLDWSRWERHLKKGGDPFYGQSYQLMVKLEEIVGEKRLGTLLKHAVSSNRSGSRMHIDIDGWLDTLAQTQRKKAARVIWDNAAKMEHTRKASRPHYAFHQPINNPELSQQLAGK